MEQCRTLEIIWRMAYATGIATRQNGENGKENWDSLKSSIEHNISLVKEKILEIETRVKFIKLINEQTKEIMNYEHKNEEGQVINEKNHFMIQSIRIPNEIDFSIVRLIQIAYNIGQLEGVCKNTDLLPRKNLNEFITDENIELINSVFY